MSPCKDCSSRSEDCHATCEDYLSWSREQKAKNKMIDDWRKQEFLDRWDYLRRLNWRKGI